MNKKSGVPDQGTPKRTNTEESKPDDRPSVNRLRLVSARQGLASRQAGLPSPSIKLYRQGIMMHRPVKGVKPPDSGGRRDVITGWSSASRRRMREYMLTHAAPAGWITIGPSFTIPGPAMESSEARQLWADYCLKVYKAGWGMIWRVEIQKRGVLHWHALLIGEQSSHPLDCKMLWMECLRALPPVDHVTVNGFQCVQMRRSALPGADVRACAVDQQEGSRGAWLRYLQDHSTKAKQEQIPEGIGRHWGVVGRDRFVEVPPIADVELTDREYSKVLRCLQRLWTPSRPDPTSPFGRSLSYMPTRGRRGHCVAFSSPITTARLCEWAKSNRETPHAFNSRAPVLGKLP